MKKVLTLVSISAALLLFGCTPAEKDLSPEDSPEENKEELVENTEDETPEGETPTEPAEPGEGEEDPNGNSEDPGENGEDPNGNGEDPNNDPNNETGDEPGENGEDPGEEPSQQNDYPEAVGKMAVLTPDVNGWIGAVSLSSSQQNLNRQANKFAFRVLDKLYGGESMVISPLSLQIALSMAVNGAEGETAREMMDVLGFGSIGLDALNAYSRSLLEQLPALDQSVKLQLADALIADNRLTVLEPFAGNLASCYYAPVESISFADQDYVKAVVNDWARRNTEGLIPELLDKNQDISSAVSVLLNALYFKAPWTTPFEVKYQLLEDQDFNTGSGVTKVDYLCCGEDIAYAERDTYRMATRTFGKEEKFELVVLLPKEEDGLQDVLSELTALDYHALRKSASYPPRLYFRIPRFETSSAYSLASALQSLGMRKAFRGDAEFYNMFAEKSENLAISDVIQKACLKLNENGVEGAAATAIIHYETAVGGEQPEPIYFYADHPFAYLVVEKTSETILFAGVYDGR